MNKKMILLLVSVLLVMTSSISLAQDSGSRLRVSFAPPDYIDPAVGNDEVGSTSLANLYDSLVFPNAAGGVDPWLAESWEVSDDGLTYTFHLRSGVTFHDGTELKASDVAYSYQRLKDIGEGYAYLLPAATVATPDDQTVSFTLDAPSGLFLASLPRLYVVNAALVKANTLADGPYGANGDYGKQWLLANDAGSGPYQVSEMRQNEDLLMTKYANWWNAASFNANAPDQVRFILNTEPATIRALMSTGELEISDTWQSMEALQALDQMDGVDITAYPTLSGFYFMMNNKRAPMDDVHCRRAMSYAFDYDQAVALEWPGTQQMVGPVPSVLAGHNPNVTVYHHDLDKANAELAQCQYAGDIASYPIEVDWVSEVPAEERYALLFQANMADIGITVNVVSTPWLSVVENVSKQETAPDIVTIYVASSLPEAGSMLKDRYHSSTAGTWQQNEWLQDPQLDAAIDDALATVDTQARYAKYEALQAQIADLAPSLFVYDQLEKHAVAGYVTWTPENNSAMLGYRIYAATIGVTNP
jgi:peptide/nickel transport system substrate-binding protein